ncbi:MAG: hypothetical protein ABR543_02095 [Gemmatimonadaceae bacterium]
MRGRDVLTLLSGLAALLVCASCDAGKSVVPTGSGRVVVHSVLSTAVGEEVILVERSLTGRVSFDTSLAFDPDDPIVSSGGVPVSGADVTIASDNCPPAPAVEDLTIRGDGRGAGVYRYRNTPLNTPPPPPFQCVRAQIVRGLRYYLRVVDPTGIVVTGATTVPDALTSGTLIRTHSLDPERETLTFDLDTARLHSRYFIQIETPYGPFFLFTDRPHVNIPGTIRNHLVRGHPPVFVPGFRQSVQASAVDTNFFDYYRSRYDPLSTTGPISHLVGGTGLFGSVLRLSALFVEVVSAVDQPIEGAYTSSPSFFGQPPERIRLYVFSQDSGVTHLSGSIDSNAGRAGILGTLQGDHVRLAVVGANHAVDTLLVFDGSFDGTAITGTVQGRTGEYVLRKN